MYSYAKCRPTHRLLGHDVGAQLHVGGLVNVGVAGVERLVLLLFGHLLDGEESVLPHLDPLGHVAHAGVLCKVREANGSVIRI